MPFDAAQQTAQTLSGQHNQIIAAALGKAAQPFEHGLRVGRIDDLDQRVAQHAGAAALEQRGEDVEFAGLGYRNHAIGERFHQAPCEADSSQSNRGRSRKALNIFSFQRRQKSRKNSESASSDS